MTLELLHVIRDNTIHLHGHQYQIMQVMCGQYGPLVCDLFLDNNGVSFLGF